MLFNSQLFILGFLPLCLSVFFLLGRWRPMWAAGSLAVASLAFYYSGSPARHLLILLLSIAFNYAVGRLLMRPAMAEAVRRAVLTAGIAINLAAIGYFKYAVFVLGAFGVPFGSISLPLGISFFTFTQIAFLVDAYRGETKEYNPVHYLLFVTYFPHLIAGPILHHKEMMPQFGNARIYKPQWDNLSIGLSVFVVGLLKKTLLADQLAPHADGLFNGLAGSPPSAADAWAGALAYTLQIYFDFSGYSDMALGLSKMIGVRLPLNFNSPYQATSIIDFWRRWHMTLSRFLRDYLYVPLGGNRRGPARRYANLLVTMLLGGLWHGAGWTFIIWGGLHGLFLATNHVWRERGFRMPAAPAWAITFMAVVAAWVFFRADNVSDAVAVLRGMAGLNGMVADAQPLVAVERAVPLLLAALLVALAAPNTQQIFARWSIAIEPVEPSRRLQWSPTLAWGIGMGAGLASLLFMVSGESPFLYFRF